MKGGFLFKCNINAINYIEDDNHSFLESIEKIDHILEDEEKNIVKTQKKNNIKKTNPKFTYNITKTKPKRKKYNKHKNFKIVENNDKCFPFQSGKGIINNYTKYKRFKPLPHTSLQDTLSFKKTIESVIKEKSEIIPNKDVKDIKNNNNEENDENNDIYLKKFVTRKYFYSDNGRRKRIKKKRKYRSDIIRKKIKSRFHKALKNIINQNLKNTGSKMLFDCLPQSFIENTTKMLNSNCFEMTYREIITTNFSDDLNKYKHSKMDNHKYLKNQKVLEYLEKNPKISKDSGFDFIKNMKYKDILEKYFISKEFEDSVYRLIEEKESQEYIQLYIYRAKNYINYYSQFGVNLKEFEDEDEIEDDDIEIEEIEDDDGN